MRDQEKTKQQLLEELTELRRSEAKWRSVAQNAPLFVAIVDQAGTLQFLNRFRPGFEPATVLGRPIYDFIQPRYHAIAKKCLEHVFHTGEGTSYESVGAGSDGSMSDYVTDVGSVIVDSEIIAATLISRDMTDRKRAEQTLRQSEERFRLLVEQAVDGIFVSDAQGHYLDVNGAGCEMFGYSREEILARTIADVVAAEEVPRIATEVARFIGGMVTRSEWRFRRKDGSFFTGEVVGRQLPDGRLQGILRDVTDRKQAEEALKKAHDELERRVEERTAELSKANEQLRREVEERQRIEGELRRSKSWLEEAQQIAKIGNWEWNVRTNEVLWSDEMYRIFGVPKATFRLNFEEHLKLIPAEDRKEYLAGLDAVIAGKDQWNREHRILLHDGNVRYVWAIGAIRRDAEGNVISLCGTTQDIMERKRAEEALQQSERQFRNYFEQGLIGMAVNSLDKRWLLVNDRLSEILGYSREELRQKTWPELTHPDDIEPNLRLFNPLLAGEIDHFTLNKRYLKKDGGIVHTTIHTRAFRNDDGTVDHIVTLIEDITERKKAEEQVRDANRKLVATLESITDGVVSFDHQWRYTYVNEAAAHSLHTSPDKLLGKVLWEAWPDAVQAKCYAEYHRAVRENVSVHFEDFYPEPLNRWYECHAYPSSEGMSLYFRDVTDRRHAEEALRRSEERFRVAFEEAPVGMMIAVGDGIITRVNHALCSITGYTPEELTGSEMCGLTHPEDSERCVPLVQALFVGKTPSVTMENRYLGKGGRVFWARTTVAAVYVPDGGMVFALGIMEDITSRKQAEEALRTSEEKYRTLVETSPDAVMMGDLEGRLTFVSHRALQMYGTENVEDLLGRNPLDFFAPADHQKFLSNLRRTLVEGVTKDVEYDFVRRDGTHLVGETSAAAIRDVTGRPMGFVAIVRDITERRQAREALERERQSLWRMLQASDHERQTISYEIHDGLAQYLAGATMQFQVHDSLKEDSPKKARKAYETAVELVRQAHSEARRLINEVRPPVIDEIGLETAISHLVHEQRQRGGPKIEYHSDVQFGRLPPILENAIYRIAQEALTNACKHSKSKKVTVTMTQEGQSASLICRARRGFHRAVGARRQSGDTGNGNEAEQNRFHGSPCAILGGGDRGTEEQVSGTRPRGRGPGADGNHPPTSRVRP